MNGRTASLLAACLLAIPVFAQTTAPAAVAAVPAPGPVPRVVKAIGHGPGGAAGLGDVLTLQVENFNTLLQQAGSCSGIVLYIGDKPVYGTKPTTCQP
ncbi:MAG TPA: hypothetical protein VF698_03680, partial [Thermoanaerobaculia bacterium]